MKKIVKLTERDLTNIIKRVINEESSSKEKDLYTLLHSLRNSINDEDKKKSLSPKTKTMFLDDYNNLLKLLRIILKGMN